MPQLKILASELGISNNGKATKIIKRIFESQPDEEPINEFIKEKYTEQTSLKRVLLMSYDAIGFRTKK